MKNKEKLKGKILLIWFVISLIGCVISIGIGSTVAICILIGQYFLVFGLLALKQFFMSIIFVLIGLEIIVVLILMQLNISVSVPVLILFDMAFFVICFLINGILKIKKLCNNCMVKVSAQIIRYSETYYDNKIVYAPVYKFTYLNKEYQVCNNNYTNFGINPKNAGVFVNIMINPNNPYEILDNHIKISTIVFLCFQIFFLLILLFVFVFLYTK